MEDGEAAHGTSQPWRFPEQLIAQRRVEAWEFMLEMTQGSSGCKVPRVLSVLSMLFECLVRRNDVLSLRLETPRRTSIFQGHRPPLISIKSYLERICKYSNCSPACFITAYIYVDRIVRRHPDLLITSLNVHRLLVTAIMVAAKFLDDAYYNNAYYAKVGGVSTVEMNRLEVEVLFRLDFRLHVTTTAFVEYSEYLQRELLFIGASQPKVRFYPVPEPAAEFAAVAPSRPVRGEDSTGSSSGPDTDLTIAATSSAPIGQGYTMLAPFEVQTPPRDVELYGRPQSAYANHYSATTHHKLGLQDHLVVAAV